MNMPPAIIEATKYIWDRYPDTHKWTWPIALGWVHWHASMGYLATAIGLYDEILGIAVVRPVKNPGDGVIPYEHDEEGQFLFIDMFACDDPRAYPLMAYAFAKRFGRRKAFAYFSRKTETALQTRDYNKLMRRVSKRLEV